MSAVPILFLQLIAILGVARLLSAVLRHVHQPPVIGEMLAGIVLVLNGAIRLWFAQDDH